jgi:peptide chain release factor subunit 1
MKLSYYSKTPKNGLVIFCGKVLMADGRTEKMINYDIEPFKPINQNIYSFEGKFKTDPLQILLQDDQKFGFIIVDGSGCLFATL